MHFKVNAIKITHVQLLLVLDRRSRANKKKTNKKRPEKDEKRQTK